MAVTLDLLENLNINEVKFITLDFAVKVFGYVKKSNRYEWIHRGEWVNDFNKLFALKKKEYDEHLKMIRIQHMNREKEEQKRIKNILDSY